MSKELRSSDLGCGVLELWHANPPLCIDDVQAAHMAASEVKLSRDILQ